MILTHITLLKFIPGATLGATPVTVTDTHDGDLREIENAIARRDEEYRLARNKLREQLLQAVENVTGKPPPLDQSLKQLASIARAGEGFDYQGMLKDIEAVERIRTDEVLGGFDYLKQKEAADAKGRLDNENAIRVLILMAVV